MVPILAGDLRGVVMFLRDMADMAEEAKRIKLAALGRLTANIAHEIRNPLAAISHAGDLLAEGAEDPPPKG
jgi:two-component system sensor histidine kinase PilS (NtrC family)